MTLNGRIGTRRRACAAGLLATSVAAVAGCETIRAMTAGTDKPVARIRSVRLQDLSLEDVSLAFDVEIDNPYSVPLPLTKIDYGLASGGRAFLTGAAPLGGSVPAGGSKLVTLPARVSFRDALSVLRGVKPGGVIAYTADLALAVDAPAVGQMMIPLRKKGELPVPAVPRVSLERIAWDRLSLDEASARLSLRVVNENEFPLDLSKLEYGLSLAGQPVGRASVRESASFGAGGEQVLEIPISFSPSGLGLAFLNVLRGDGAEYELDGSMSFDGAFGRVELPYASTGDVPFTR